MTAPVTPRQATDAEWRVIDEFPRYEVSDDGRVRLRTSGANMKPCALPSGYITFRLFPARHGGASRYAHRLVLTAFAGPCPDGHEGAHLNGVRDDNRIGNLAWTTRTENHRHKALHGTQPRGERVWNSKMTPAAVRTIRRRLARGDKQLAIANDFAITRTTVGDIANQRTWRHVA